MSDLLVGFLVVILMFTFLMGGAWIFCALGVAGVLGIFLYGVDVGGAVSRQIWGALDNFILTCIPLFVLAGELMLRSGISSSLYKGVTTWVGRLPGGLLHTNVVSCALFAAISGVSMATAATMGTVAIPDQKAKGYDDSLVLGSLTASGTLGILIPPSVTMIIYGAWMQVSIGRLFAGGIIPGIIIAAAFMLYIGITCARNPSLAPRVSASWKDRLSSIKDMWPGLLLIFIILGGIFSGLMTPTETAAVAATTALILTVILRKFSLRLLYDSALNAMHTTAMVMIIYVSANVMVMSLIYLGMVTKIPSLIVTLNLPPIAILAIIYLLYLVGGCFMGGYTLLMLTLPFVQPLVLAMGTDLIWFGIVVTVLLETGLVTPPVGMNLFVIMGISGASLVKVVRSVIPFFLILLLAVVLLNVFPQLATWLPDILFG